MIMKLQESSSTIPYSSTFKGNFSSRALELRLHFCLNGREKYRRLLQLNSGNADLESYSHETESELDVPTLVDLYTKRGYSLPEAEIHTDMILALKDARLRFLQAWTYLYVDPQPLILWSVLSAGILHLIVECQPGTTKTIKELSADCLVFFNEPGNGTPTLSTQITAEVLQPLTAEEIEAYLEKHA